MTRAHEIEARIFEIFAQQRSLNDELQRLFHEQEVLRGEVFATKVQKWLDDLVAFPIWQKTLRETDIRNLYAFNKRTIPKLLNELGGTRWLANDFLRTLGKQEAVRVFLDNLIACFGMGQPYWPGDWASRFYVLCCYHLTDPEDRKFYRTEGSPDPEILVARDYLWKAVFALADEEYKKIARRSL